MSSGVVRRPLKAAKLVLASIGSFVDQVFKPGPVKARGSRKSARRIRDMLHIRGGEFPASGLGFTGGQETKLINEVLKQGHEEDRRVTEAPRQKET